MRTAKRKAIRRLKRCLESIPPLIVAGQSSGAFERWRRDTEVAIRHTFRENPDYVEDFQRIHYWALFSPSTEQDKLEAFLAGLKSAQSMLESMINEIHEYWPDDEESPMHATKPRTTTAKSNRVFIVHGHDRTAKVKVERHLKRLGLDPVVLHDQPNEGRTIIEKFEAHADVAFAVVLLTPDDVGGPKSAEGLNLRPRARQNVIFELGFFIGKLSRKRVAALVVDHVETPSDYDGVVFLPMSSNDGWKEQLEKELRSVGLEVRSRAATAGRSARPIREVVYRRRRNSETWHFCTNCSYWPTRNYLYTKKPSRGQLCKQCKTKAREGRCRPTSLPPGRRG